MKHFVVSPEPQLSQRPAQFTLLQEALWFGKITQQAAKKVKIVTTTADADPTDGCKMNKK